MNIIKYFLISVLLVATPMAVGSFIKPYVLEEEHAAAKVEQHDGLYIFMFSKPVAQYETLGTIEKKGIVASGKPDEMLQLMIKKAKKDHPTCQAIIFTEVNMYKADCIKFK